MLGKAMDLAAKRRSAGGALGLEKVGPAEAAVAAYFASRKQIRISASADFRHFLQHGCARQGAGRIEGPLGRATPLPFYF